MKKQVLRVLCIVLSIGMLIGCLPAYAADSGVKATYDEAYYATTDYYGNLLDGGVVKSYTVNGQTSLTDYGTYDEIINLTDATEPATQDGKVEFNFTDGEAPDHFYFEGKTAEPFQNLPWTFEVQYKLNGVATKAEDLAGKTGEVEITVNVTPNDKASDYAKNNYVLMAAAIFNQDNILSLEAPGAQVQLVGNLRTVIFMCMPGEEATDVIRVGSDDFSFGGLTFLMMPATLSQLDMISELSGSKDELEENYNLLSDSLDEVLDAVNGMGDSLNATADGLDELNSARATVSANKGTLYAQASTALDDIENLNGTLDNLPDHLDSASQAIDDTSAALDKVNTAADDLQEQLKDTKDDLDSLEKYLKNIASDGDDMADDLEKLGKFADKLSADYEKLLPTIAALQLGVGAQQVTMQGMTAAEVQTALEKAQMLHQVYQCFGTGGTMTQDQFCIAAMVASGMTATAASAALSNVNTVNGNIASLVKAGQTQADATAYVLSQMTTEQQTAYKTVVGLQQAYDTFKGTDNAMDKQEFFAAMIFSSALKQNPTADDAAKKTMAVTAVTTASTIFTTFAGSDAAMDEQEFFAAMIYMNGNGTVADATAKTQADKLTYLLTETNSLSSSVKSLANALGTSGLAGDTSDLLDDASAAIKRLLTLSDTADEVIDSLDAVLDAADTLGDVADKYTPELKTTLSETKTTVSSLQTTVTDTKTFLSTLESVLKQAGTQLDAGTEDSLSGLSETLRDAASGLSTTSDVQAAKDNISSLIEDTWEKYTGEENNMLNMDSTAEAESLTDSRNDTPQSIQILIRTQEIKAAEEETETEEAETAEKTTFWQRVGQMFVDLWNTITGIFH